MPFRKKAPVRKQPKKKVVVKATKRRMSSALPDSIFPNTKNAVFLYKNPFDAQVTTGGGIQTYFRWRCNDLYDFDYDDKLGNKQPLYYDSLLTSTGPYHRYLVYAWKITLQILNVTDYPCDVIVDTGTLFSATESDTVTEITNRPGVISRYITGQNNAHPSTTISYFSKLAKYTGNKSPEMTQYGGIYNTSTAYPVIGTCLVRTVDATSTPAVRVKVTAKLYSKLLERDATMS